MLLLPIGHEHQKFRKIPYVTIVLVGINVAIFLFFLLNSPKDKEIRAGLVDTIEYYAKHPYLKLPIELEELLAEIIPEEQQKDFQAIKERGKGARVPDFQQREEQEQLNKKAMAFLEILHATPEFRFGHFPGNRTWWSYFTTMFFHSGVFHLLGNMLFLYVVGCLLEDTWGKPFYLCFYLAGGIWATFQHDLGNQTSMIPLVGASGAIAAAMGAFFIRFIKTRIRFFYLIGIWIKGNFYAPAWVVMPIWFFLQVLMDRAAETPGVAYWAHIGGFMFGVLTAVGISVSRFEEKFIEPYMEDESEIRQHPLFLRAMELTQQRNYVQATSLLRQVIRDQPDHIEAMLELQRVAESTRDMTLISQSTTMLIESLIRLKESNLLLDHIRSYRRNYLRSAGPLPAKTMMMAAEFFERLPDYVLANEIFDDVILDYPEDAVKLKALLSSARICLERTGQKLEGADLLRKAYADSSADSSWKSILESEFRKHSLPIPATEPRIEKVAAAVAAGDLPNTNFDGQGRNAILCWIDDYGPEGIHLKNEKGLQGILAWNTIHSLSVGRVKQQSGEPKDFLILDLIATDHSGKRIYRTFSYRMNFKKLQPEQTAALEAYKAMVQEFIGNADPMCIPDPQSCMGPNFLSFGGLEEYDAHVQRAVRTQETS